MTTRARWLGSISASILALACAARAEDRLSRIPGTITEISVPLPLPMEPPTADRETTAATCWRASYDTSGASTWTIELPATSPPAERIDLWIDGDGSGNVLELSAYHAPSQTWLEQAAIPLDFTGARHLVVPAGNPIHAFHPEVTSLRIRVSPSENAKATSGQIALRDAKLARTVVVKESLPAIRPPGPVFDTWGGPEQPQLTNVMKAGVTLHLIPVGFPRGNSPAERADYAVKAIPWAKQAGLTVGLAFYPTPPPAWLDANKELLCRSPGAYYDRPGGAFLSPWHPRANDILGGHIREVLEYLRSKNLLDEIDLVELCPGEEGEVSFEWNHVWAFDDHAVAAYRQFLEDHYRGDIAALNRDWVTQHASFDVIDPPADPFPDREHWVFTEFYRLSMLRRCVFMADAVSQVFEPKQWLWMAHSIGNSRQRFFSARYPAYYTENLRRLGCADYVHVAALDWQMPEDIRQVQETGARAIAEIDVQPSRDRLEWTFSQAKKFGCDGVFIGVAEILVDSTTGSLTERGALARKLIETYRQNFRE